MIDIIKARMVENEILHNISVPDMYNQILGFYGNLEDGMVCCPFHHEKTGSFSYTPVVGTGIWNCFAGCGKGDAIELYRTNLKINHGISLSRIQTIQKLIEIPDIKRTLTITDLSVERKNHTNIQDYLVDMMHGGRKVRESSLERVSASARVRNADTDEEFIEAFDHLLKFEMPINRERG